MSTVDDTTPADGPQSARDILDELHSHDAVARLAAQIKTGDAGLSGMDVIKSLAFADDRLCLTIEHDAGTEYVWLTDGWQRVVAQLYRERDTTAVDPIVLEPADLERRLSNPIGVELAGETKVPRPEADA